MNEMHNAQIAKLYVEMYEKMMVYARAAVENESLAEEAVQETFYIACQKPDALCSSPNPQGWLILTLRNTIRNMNSSRATARRIVQMYLLDQAAEFAIHKDNIDVKIQYADIADSEEFALLYEMAIEGRSHAEMAHARSISVAACKKRVQRAKELLKKNFDF